jgi:hypothetical protein
MLPRFSPGKAPSRVGKKQVVAYLDPKLSDASYRLAARNRWTIQEMIAACLNRSLEIQGAKPVFPIEHMRLIRRTDKPAAVRHKNYEPSCRLGKKAISGWFQTEHVDYLNQRSAELMVRAQDFVEWGLRDMLGLPLTGALPDEIKIPTAKPAKKTIDEAA